MGDFEGIANFLKQQMV